jgi:hypothetical protein
MGILGMDCLRHYCIQLDFATQKVRFLDPDHVSKDNLGEAFPLTISLCAFVHDTLMGIKADSLIDTGCNFDGDLTPKLFKQWTNQVGTGPSALPPAAHFPNGMFGGQMYTNLYVYGGGGGNSIGLSFLARHLVTLNFPRRVMYLQCRNIGPLSETNDFFTGFYTNKFEFEKN